MLVGSVVIHGPNFLVAGAVADKINLALCDAGDSAAETEDDFVGKLVRDYADCIGGGVVVVLLAEHLRRGSRALDVVEPALHSDFVGSDAQVAEGEHGSVGRRRGAPV